MCVQVSSRRFGRQKGWPDLTAQDMTLPRQVDLLHLKTVVGLHSVPCAVAPNFIPRIPHRSLILYVQYRTAANKILR